MYSIFSILYNVFIIFIYDLKLYWGIYTFFKFVFYFICCLSIIVLLFILVNTFISSYCGVFLANYYISVHIYIYLYS